MPDIRSFIFDIGNVILPFDFNRALRRVQAQTVVPLESLAAAFRPLQDDYESGRIGHGQFVEQSIAMMRFQGTPAEFVAAWREIFEENPAMTRLIEQLRPRYPLYLLSNTSDLHLDYIVARYPVFAHFTDAVYSYRAGCLKPARSIYEIAARQFGVEPGQTVYIDDIPVNVAAARECGFHAIRYDLARHGALLEELAALGVAGLES